MTDLTWLPASWYLAMMSAPSRLPVIGPSLEPLGTMAALGLWGYRSAPGFALAAAEAWMRPGTAAAQAIQATPAAYDRAFRGWADDPGRDRRRPGRNGRPARFGAFGTMGLREHYVAASAVRYGPGPRHRLDVWQRQDVPPRADRPVLVYVPGGGWVHGSRSLQGYGLLAHLAELGWTCLAIDYRVAPRHRWPAHIRDVKRAVAWARRMFSHPDGSPRVVAVAGASAGGHLAALAGLSRNPDFEPRSGLDTAVDAVVSLYGRYDWTDRSTPERVGFMNFLENVVVRRRLSTHSEVFEAASPIAQVHPDAPPFLVVHGDNDFVIPVEQAREFVDEMRAASRSPVLYAELPGAAHGFDLVSNARTAETAAAVTRFLSGVRPRAVTGGAT